MTFRWPWQQIIRPDRATLTLLPEGRVIIGCPKDITDEARQNLVDAVQEWFRRTPAERSTLLVIPFPVDVVDHRRPAAHDPTDF